MSRSSAEWYKNSIQPPPPPPLLSQPAQLIHGVYTVISQYGTPVLPYVALPLSSPAAYVPIPLTGDDDDNEDPTRTRTNILPMHGSASNYNMNTLLHSNILESEYFKALYQLKTYHEVIDEIYRSVQHVEAWQVGTSRIPSTCFCLLLKFMLMKLTYKQMKGILETEDCPYVRAVGLLYLRYTCPPKDLWKWYEPFLEDEEIINPSADTTINMTVGEYCIKLLTDMSYYGTTLPRIPVPIERKMKVMLLLLGEKKRRRRVNERSVEAGLFVDGDKVRAIYGDDENEPCWYDAVIDYKDMDMENKYWVTFPEYGNTECVDLGDMELILIEKERSNEVRERSDRDRNDRHTENKREEGEERSSSSNRQRDKSDRGQHRERDKKRDSSRDRGLNKKENSIERNKDAGRGDNDRGRDNRNRNDEGRNTERIDRRDESSNRNKDSRSRSRSHGRKNRDDDGPRGGDSRRNNKNRSRDRERKEDRAGSRNDEGYRDRSTDKDQGRQKGSRSRSQQEDKGKDMGRKEETLMEKVMKLQRDASAAVGRNYGNRPVSYKGSLALKVDRFTVRKKSQSPERRRVGNPGNGGDHPGDRNGDRGRRSRSRGKKDNIPISMMSSDVVSRDQLDRMKRLREQYGDASSK